eukprot:gene3836-4093_t
MLMGEYATATPAAGKDKPNVEVYANGVSSDGSSEEDIEALAESELANLNLDLSSNSDNSDGYLDEVRKLLFQPSKLSKFIGMDVTNLMSVPLFIMEPYSMLQKMAEIMEYTELLDQANAAEDPYERIALVAAFLVSPFGAAERTWKPFNPLLGETFELEELGNNVSQHPAVSAAHAENQSFAYDIVSAPATKFMGNTLEVYPKGRSRITLRRTGEEYSHVPPQAKVHNLVLGRTWVDSFGTFLVQQHDSGLRVELEFKPCGWFGSNQYEFEGFVYDKQDQAHGYMSGKWNSYVDLEPCNPDGSMIEGAEKRRLWTCADKPEGDMYGCTQFALQLAEERGQQWQARWFEQCPDMEVLPGEESAEAVPLWRWNGKYTQQCRNGMPAGTGGWQEEVLGKGFAPWSSSN